jgi:acetyl-CoA carboxylase biotin carboxyl carrier protein
MKEGNLTEFSLEEEGKKLVLKRERKEEGRKEREKVEYKPGEPEPVMVKEVVSQEKEDHYISITAPMVGTFYRAPAPDAPPYVEVGSEVKKGEVLCIIEAMKLMNEVKSEYDGRIVKILVENGTPIEYGQELFLLEKK